MRRLVHLAVCGLFVAALRAGARAEEPAFVNWESPHVHPLELTPGGDLLLAVDTAAARLEVLDASGTSLRRRFTVPVGLDPVTVRARTADEAWVVNHVSDSISVVDLAARAVVRTIGTRDEPCDVVFAGEPLRAFVSCSQANVVQVFTLTGDLLATLRITGEDPRALAVSPDGTKVYAAIFESGNRSTILGGGLGGSQLSFPRNVVNDPAGPWGGVNPPPNSGAGFAPPHNPQNPPPPRGGLIVKKDAAQRWRDDNGGDWTELVSGALSAKSDRPAGWDLYDHDVAIVDTATLTTDYVDGLMNLCMALAVNPADGSLVVVGTEGTNEVRYEPNLRGRFLRVRSGHVAAGSAPVVSDLNPHLDYTVASLPQVIRDRAVGDPRAVVFRPDGQRGWVAGMGSNNLIVIDAAGRRVTSAAPVEVGEGPTGLVHDAQHGPLFALNRFEGSISVVDLASSLERQRVPLFDPTPEAVREGRRHLYGTHEGSGLGQISCASCHVDGRTDRLAWDLGDPAGTVRPFEGNCPEGGCTDWHPMKGPMLTQTLQDIVGKEPHHWRGDRLGLEEFAGAYVSLQGADAPLGAAKMQRFEDFLATIHFPPNPYREFDNSLPRQLQLTGHYATGRFGPAGVPLPRGDALHGLALFRPPNFLAGGGLACVTCHALPTGAGTPLAKPSLMPIPPGPNGEAHLQVTPSDGSTNRAMKIPQLRSLYERTGFDFTQSSNLAGFGFLHDGSVDSIARFVNEPAFSVASDQETADLVAFLLSFSGSDLPQGSTTDPQQPLGAPSLDTHAAVGVQVTLRGPGTPARDLQRYAQMLALAALDEVGLVAHGRLGGVPRGWTYVGQNRFQSDRALEALAASQLPGLAAPGAELTVTVVPKGTEFRLGIDRDEDGDLDRDELELVVDPENQASTTMDNLVAFCFGDGRGTACPCGNDAPAGSTTGCLNSSGEGARLVANGAPDTSDDTLRFRIEGGPIGSFALLVSGQRALPTLSPGTGISSFDGLRCVGGGILRHGTRAIDALGETPHGWGRPDGPLGGLGAHARVAPGEARFYQAFLRENPALGCGHGLTTTNAVRVTWR